MTTKNLTAVIEIDAHADDVWTVVSDLKRMPEWSPQCRRMRPLGTVRPGGYTINLNRHGWKYWPTVSRIERFDPKRTVAFRTLTNNSVWSFEITPTPTGCTLTERRTVPDAGTTWISRTIVAHLLGGEDPFDIEMTTGMQTTLNRIKSTIEQD